MYQYVYLVCGNTINVCHLENCLALYSTTAEEILLQKSRDFSILKRTVLLFLIGIQTNVELNRKFNRAFCLLLTYTVLHLKVAN